MDIKEVVLYQSITSSSSVADSHESLQPWTYKEMNVELDSQGQLSRPKTFDGIPMSPYISMFLSNNQIFTDGMMYVGTYKGSFGFGNAEGDNAGWIYINTPFVPNIVYIFESAAESAYRSDINYVGKLYPRLGLGESIRFGGENSYISPGKIFEVKLTDEGVAWKENEKGRAWYRYASILNYEDYTYTYIAMG